MSDAQTERLIQAQGAYREMLSEKAKAARAMKNFLETTPPNVSATIENLFGMHHPQAATETWSISMPEIQLHCDVCDGPRLFASDSEYIFKGWTFVTYKCKNCGRQRKTFALLVVQAPKNSEKTTAEVIKLGEFPPFGAPISARVAKLLGKDDLELYRKGMRAEAQGLGIGAATYFRRIVDSKSKLLVREIRDAATKLGGGDLSIYDAALAETQFSKAVDMLKDAIPAKLLILDGRNPLTLLYQPLSVGLHDLTDEECLQQAADIRMLLTALLENVADVLRDQAELQAAANRLTQRKP